MNLTSRLKEKLSGFSARHKPPKALPERREFVYLDDVSVYSLLASRKEGIATEFTQNETTSLNGDVGSSIGLGLGRTGASLNSRLQTGNVHSSQVIRKAIIQSSFRELRTSESSNLVLGKLDMADSHRKGEVTDLGEFLTWPTDDSRVIGENRLSRGELIEVEVELQADPIFHLAEVITTVSEFVEGNQALFNLQDADMLAEIPAIAKILDSLLYGLVPIKGRLIDFKAVSINDQEVLVRRELLSHLPEATRANTMPVFVVGVAQGNLFWKDIRRILFSGARYSVFCRISTDGILTTWRPIKLAEMLTGIIPSFDESIRQFGEEARRALVTGFETTHGRNNRTEQADEIVIEQYLKLLTEHYDRSIDDELLENLIKIPRDEGWLRSVDGSRPVFRKLTEEIDAVLGVETPSELAYRLRRETLKVSDVGNSEVAFAESDEGHRSKPTSTEERFLDTEIIAIYW